MLGLPIYTEATDKCAIFDDATRAEGLLSTASRPIKNEGKVLARLNLASKKFVIPKDWEYTIKFLLNPGNKKMLDAVCDENAKAKSTIWTGVPK